MDLDQLAEKYADWYKTPRGSYVGENEYQCLAKHIGDCSGKKIIELGCGTGFFLRKFAVDAEETVGLDITEGMLTAARKIAQEKDLDINFIQGDVTEEIPYPDNYFDIVYSNSMIEFFEAGEELEAVLTEMWRVLKPGGKYVIGVLNSKSTWAYKRIAETMEKDSIFSEATFYSWEELKAILEKFAQVKIESTLFVPPYFKEKEDFEWFKNLESEFKARYPKRGALLVASVVKEEGN
ncbi:class I SAM-dependent methyltransferase [Halanaerobium sp. Z-7514]|uniref:Class I SAM-dependent methyltransferase n=1 Tax=Halanaerobium polyolivorans TaxID=2886943 RepID=A0AAW4WYF8_9FIRM|nr:class I SAM-dependent methyltransferase [Halanaerobium polyolivorans]MCC3144079.1 class I SAM-dependent methyltransferase [Halanaerobium polyolivorans]